MTRYIVSTRKITQDCTTEYNHDAVKLAYKAGAVVELRCGLGWVEIYSPCFDDPGEYRAIVTSDMPQEIQDLVNWTDPEGVRETMKKVCDNFVARGNRPQRHKWADVIIAIANGEPVERKSGPIWVPPGAYNPISHPSWGWRVKPKTIMIGDTEVQTPETKAPDLKTVYYCPDPLEMQHLYTKWHWNNDEQDQRVLRSGMIHLTAQAAQEHALALIKVSGGQHPDNYEVAK